MDTRRGHGNQNLMSHRQANFESASRSDFAIVSTYNCPGAPAQYCNNTCIVQRLCAE
jgi:hypothetical protein